MLELVKPFAINNSMSILDFGCGARRAERAIVKEFDVWITGIERDRMQVELGKLLSSKRRAGAQGRGQLYDPENFVSRSGGYRLHPVNGHDVTGSNQREVILARLENSLKTRGQLTVADYVRAEKTAPDDPLIAAALGARRRRCGPRANTRSDSTS